MMAPVPIVLRSMAHFPLAHSQPKMHRRRVCHSNFPQKRSRRRAAGLCLVVMPQPLQCGVSEEMRPARSPRLPHHLRGAPSCCSARRSRSLSCVSKRAQKHGRSDPKLAPNLQKIFRFFPCDFHECEFSASSNLRRCCRLFCARFTADRSAIPAVAGLFSRGGIVA